MDLTRFMIYFRRSWWPKMYMGGPQLPGKVFKHKSLLSWPNKCSNIIHYQVHTAGWGSANHEEKHQFSIHNKTNGSEHPEQDIAACCGPSLCWGCANSRCRGSAYYSYTGSIDLIQPSKTDQICSKPYRHHPSLVWRACVCAALIASV